MARTIATLSIQLEARMAKFESDLKRANRIAFKQTRKMENSFKRAGKNMVRALGIGAGVAIFTRGMRASVNAAVEFEKAMDEVSTLVGDTTDMDRLTDSVREMSRQFGKAPVEEAKALYQIISAGAETASEQMDLLTASNKLAIGGVTDVATAADGLTGILNAYGLAASEAERISDIMFATMVAGKTTIGEIAASISDVTPIAATMGVTFEEVGAALATVTAITGNTSIATTQLRQAISSIGAPAEKSKKLFAELGIEFGKMAITKGGGLLPFFKDVIEKTGGSTIQLKKLFGSVEAVNAILALATDDFGKFSNALDATRDSAGDTDAAVSKMTSGSAFQLDKLKVSFTLLAESVGIKLLPVLSMLSEIMLKILTPSRTLNDVTMDGTRAMKEMSDAIKVGTREKLLAAKATAELAIIEHQVFVVDAEKKLKTQKVYNGLLARLLGTLDKYSVEVNTLSIKQKGLSLVLTKVNKLIKENDKRTKDVTKSTDELAAVVQKTAAELKSAAEEAKKFEEAQKALAESARTLTEKYNPLTAAVNEYHREMAIAFSVQHQMSKDDFEFTIDAIRKAFEEARAAINGAMTTLETFGKEEEEVERITTGMAAVIENSFKRLDDTFADFWSNLVKNGKISLKSIKDLFLSTIAQMLHAALTQPIVLRIGAIFTGGIASGAANAAGGLFGGAEGSGLGSIFGGFASIFKGTQIQDAFNNFSSMFSGSAANWQFGVAGLVGGILGDKIFGGQGGIGGSVGAVVGMAAFGPIGAIVGGILGGFVGGLFGSDTPTITAGGDIGASERARRNPFESDLGGFFIAGKGGVKEFRDNAAKSIQEFDAVIAAFLNAGQLEKVTDALKGWSLNLKKEAITLENLLGSRFETILGSFSQTIQDYVSGFSGLEDQTAALQRYVTALNTVGAVIAVFADSNISEILSSQLADAAKTSTERLAELGTTLADLFVGFDGTPEQMNEISRLVDARYRGELEYLAAIDSLINGIAQSIEAQQAKIRETVEGPRSFDEIFGEAQSLLDSLSGVGSPEELAQLVASIQSLVDKAFGGLDESGQIAQADMLIAFLNQVQLAAEERANALAAMVIAEGQILRDQALLFADSISAPLELNVQATDAVNDSIQVQTQVIIDGNESNTNLLEELIALVRSGNDDQFSLRTGG